MQVVLLELYLMKFLEKGTSNLNEKSLINIFYKGRFDE
jgi:hypothetical protein